MKTLFAAALLLLISLLSACNRDTDAAIRGKVPGTWVFEFTQTNGSVFRSEVAYERSGISNGKITVQSVSNTVRVFELKGYYSVSNGFLIDVVTNRSQSEGPLLMVSRYRIIQADNKLLIVDPEPESGLLTNRVVFRRIQK